MGCGSSCLPINTLGVVAAKGGGQADMSSLTKKPSRFSFRSPQNVNRGDCNQFTLATAWNMARLFSIFFCFVAPTLADYAVLPEEATGPNLLTRILMDACMCVASRSQVRRCTFLFPLPSSCSMSPLQMMSLITSLTPVSLPHISPQSFTNTPLCQSLQSHLHPTPIVPKSPLQGVAFWSDSSLRQQHRTCPCGHIWRWFRCLSAKLYGGMWRLVLVFALSMIWMEEGTCRGASPPPSTQTHMFPHRGVIARQAWRDPQKPRRVLEMFGIWQCLWAPPPSCWPARHFHTTDHVTSPCPSPSHKLPHTAEP